MQKLTNVFVTLLIMMNMACQSQEETAKVNSEYVPWYRNLYPALGHPEQVYVLNMKMCPRGMGKLKKLQYLYFGECYVSKGVMDDINKAESLTDISIYDCDVDSLYFNSGLQSRIKYLNLPLSRFGNADAITREISKLKNLEYLGIQLSNIPFFPLELSKIKGLKSVSIGNKVETFDFDQSFQNLSHLKHLEELAITSPDLSEFPGSFQNLSNLKNIDFYNCQSLSVPNIFEQIQNWTNLDFLGLGYMNIKTIPDALVKLQTLKTIDVEGNENIDIRQVLSVISKIQNLETLNLSYCINATEEETFGQLDDLGKLRNLKKLDFTGNELVDSKYFWSLIGQLANLEELKLAEFPAQIFPDIFNLTQLKKLDLTFTGPRNVENIDKFPPSLEVLKYAKSVLDDFPMEIIHSPNLVSVNLHDNDIKEVPEEISEMKNLVHLDLSYNQLEVLPESIKALKNNLKYLNLMGNPVGEDMEKLAQIKQWLPYTEVFGGR